MTFETKKCSHANRSQNKLPVSHCPVKYKQKKILGGYCSPSSESVQLKREQDMLAGLAFFHRHTLGFKMFCSTVETDILPARRLTVTFASTDTVWTASY